jgi:hypothetical protein
VKRLRRGHAGYTTCQHARAPLYFAPGLGKTRHDCAVTLLSILRGGTHYSKPLSAAFRAFRSASIRDSGVSGVCTRLLISLIHQVCLIGRASTWIVLVHGAWPRMGSLLIRTSHSRSGFHGGGHSKPPAARGREERLMRHQGCQAAATGTWVRATQWKK